MPMPAAAAAALFFAQGDAHAVDPPALFAPLPAIVTSPKVPTAPNDKLKYYGGRVISNVKVIAVFWGPNISTAFQSQIGAFYSTITGSPFLDWLTEYDTIGKVGFVDGMPGSNQHIGRGTYVGGYVITPENTSVALTDDDIQKELVAQINGGHLPQPALDADGNVDSLNPDNVPSASTSSGCGCRAANGGSNPIAVGATALSVLGLTRRRRDRRR
jgi:MYXO-CTERM domain-containing protein